MTSNGPRLRPEMSDVPAYRAGRPAPEGAYKISSNENPYPPLPSVLEALGQRPRRRQPLPRLRLAPAGRRAGRPLRRAGRARRGRHRLGRGGAAARAGDRRAPATRCVFAWRSFEAYPIITPGRRRDRGAGAARRRRPARPGRDGRRGDRPDPAGLRLQPQQPDRDRRAPGRARALPRRGARGRARRARRGVPRVRPRPARSPTASTLYRDRPNVCVLRTFSKAYGLAAPARRLRRRARAGGRGAAQDGRAVRRQRARAGGAVASLAAEAELLARVEAMVGERDRVAGGAAATGLGRARRRRRTSSGCGSASARRSSRPRARRPASWCRRSAARAYG